MTTTIDALRCVIASLIREARMGKIVDMPRTRGIKLVRSGGLSPVRQTHKIAPERHGVWAFVWPYVEPFMLGSTTPRGIVKSKSDEELEAMTDSEREDYYTKQTSTSRYGQLKREGWKYFVHEGPLYTRINVPGSTLVDDGWYLTTGAAFNSYLNSRLPIEQFKDSIASQRAFGQKFDALSLAKIRSNPTRTFSRDEFEVFIPRPEERTFVSKKRNHDLTGDEE